MQKVKGEIAIFSKKYGVGCAHALPTPIITKEKTLQSMRLIIDLESLPGAWGHSPGAWGHSPHLLFGIRDDLLVASHSIIVRQEPTNAADSAIMKWTAPMLKRLKASGRPSGARATKKKPGVLTWVDAF